MQTQQNEFINITRLKYPKLAKCNSCNRVRDIYYKVALLDVTDTTLMIGDLDFCKVCGDNFNKILGGELDPDQKVLKTFDFTGL